MPPSNITVKRIDNPTESNVKDATDIFCKLMAHTPFFDALTGNQPHLLPILISSLIGEIAFKIGDMYGAFDEHGAMVGFQGWIPPGKLQLGGEHSEEKEQLGEFIKALPTDEFRVYTLQTLGHDLPKLVDVLSGIPECELTTYWCNFNFVKTEYHKQGIAKAMMDLAVQKSKATGWKQMALSTTTARNIPIYERLGFVNEGCKLMRTPINQFYVWVFVKTLE